MTAVMLVGDLPATGVLRQVGAIRVTTPSADAAPLFVDQVIRALRTHGAVVVLYPSWKADPAVRLLRLLRGVVQTDRVACVPLDLPPVALSLVADQLAHVAASAAPGVVAGLAPYLAADVCAGARLTSVARLDHVKTGLGAHVSSYLPGGAFSVLASPVADIHRITSARPVQEFARRPGPPVLMLVAQQGGDLAWIQQSLAPALGAVSVTPIAVQPLSAEFWGVRKYTEFVAFSGHPHALSWVLSAVPYRPCRWCGESTAAEICPFCGAVQPPADGPAERPRPAEGARPPRPEPPSEFGRAPAEPPLPRATSPTRPPERPPAPASAAPEPAAPPPSAQPPVQPPAQPPPVHPPNQPPAPPDTASASQNGRSGHVPILSAPLHEDDEKIPVPPPAARADPPVPPAPEAADEEPAALDRTVADRRSSRTETVIFRPSHDR
ncbi:hypothetical protein [Actinomadura bangladeshensis]|uniref:Uncharacterized protein n=1 Tax=Actinomadura bangladeshensis TaxID=453573 RepID=A0A6L9QIU9_9ACTN|nr:hypothetical protein [Actinomadura bangladeshensis]NEA25430.1 hypothetical protein [Actinomadura bangladeshensis]